MSAIVSRLGAFFFRHRNWAFPVLVGGFFAVAIPPSDLFGSPELEDAKDYVAVLVAVSGLILRGLVIGHVHVRRAGQGRSIHAATLFTDGMFSLCRNPLYTGNILIFVGIFLMHGNVWTVTLGSASYIFIYYAIVQAEEAYLLKTFGEPYAAYCARVPRWVPNIFRLRAATVDMPFNLRRVLLVEYPNIGITVIALTLAEFYEQISGPLALYDSVYVGVLAGIIGIAIGWVVLMRFAKKARLIESN